MASIITPLPPLVHFPLGCSRAPKISLNGIGVTAKTVVTQMINEDLEGISRSLGLLGITGEQQAPAALQMVVGYGISHPVSLDHERLGQLILDLREMASNDPLRLYGKGEAPFLIEDNDEMKCSGFLLAGLIAFLKLKIAAGEPDSGAVEVARRRKGDDDVSLTGPLYVRSWDMCKADAYERARLLSDLLISAGKDRSDYSVSDAAIRQLFEEACKAALLVPDAYPKSLALKGVADAMRCAVSSSYPHPIEGLDLVYEDAIEETRKIGDNRQLAHALGMIAYSLQNERGLSVGRKALKVCGRIKDDAERALVLAAIRTAFDRVEDFMDSDWRLLSWQVVAQGGSAAKKLSGTHPQKRTLLDLFKVQKPLIENDKGVKGVEDIEIIVIDDEDS